jgi:ABC-type phosphate transport system auxiliary subunit
MSDDGKTEVEFAGVKFRGGKIFVIITALSTLGGGLYAGFEFYKDYVNMRTKIEKYTAPDLSGFDKKLAVLREEMQALTVEVKAKEELIQDARDYTKEIKTDLKDELHIMSKQVDSIEKRGKEAFRLVRDSIDKNDTKVRKMVTVNSDRFDTRREQIRKDMDALETRLKKEMKELRDSISNQIKKALENPLANMRK